MNIHSNKKFRPSYKREYLRGANVKNAVGCYLNIHDLYFI